MTIKVNPMRSTPRTRSQFERNLNILTEAMRQERFFMPTHMPTEGLRRARRLPNGRIDLTSIDESVRLMANTMANFELESEPSDD
jgi:hypothetical protein